MSYPADNVLKVQNHLENSYTVGKKQWLYLDELIEKYESTTSGVLKDNSFMAHIWVIEDGITKKTIYWDKYIPSHTFLPLQVYLKILVLYVIDVENMSPAPIFEAVTTFMNQMLPIIMSLKSPVLTASRGNPWIPLSFLSSADISVIIDQLTTKNGALSVQLVHLISYMEKMQTIKDEGLAFFSLGFVTPWSEQQVSVSAWLNQLKHRHNLIKEKVPFSPLSNET